MSDTRTTGERERLPAALGELVAAARAESPVPVAVRFGIGTAELAAEVGRIADGVIIGSRLVRAVSEAGDADRAAAAVADSSATRVPPCRPFELLDFRLCACSSSRSSASSPW